MAFGALKALKDAVRRVPHAIPLEGYADIAIVGYVSPRLTTTYQT